MANHELRNKAKKAIAKYMKAELNVLESSGRLKPFYDNKSEEIMGAIDQAIVKTKQAAGG